MERETRLELATICLEGRGSSQLSYSRNICVVVREGFEPSKPKATDLQSVGFDHSPTSPVEKYYCSGQALVLRLTHDNLNGAGEGT